MTYLTFWQELSTAEGSNESEIARNTVAEEFIEYFNSTPDRLTGTIDGVSVDFVVQNIKYGEPKADEKLILTLPNQAINEGSIASFNGKDWLCVNEENRAVQSHNVFLAQLLNNSISTKAFTEKCVLKGKSAFAGFEQSSVVVVDNRLIMRVQKNVNTDTIFLNQRFIFSNKYAYKVVNIDDFTHQAGGIIECTLERDQVNPERDDLANNIAYQYEEPTAPTPTDGVFFNTSEAIVKFSVESTFEVYEYISGAQQGTTFTFRIDNVDAGKYEVVSTTGNSITIKGLDYPYSGQLVAIKDIVLTETQIPIKLTSIM